MRLMVLAAVAAGVLALMLRAVNRERSMDLEYQALLDAVERSSLPEPSQADLRGHIAAERARQGVG